MESNLNKYIAVAYRLYTLENGKEKLVEEAPEEEPFQFISGYGIALDAFENAVSGLEKGAEFDFTLPKEKAYGDFEESHVVNLDRDIFSVNGHFDRENIFEGAMIQLQNEDGNRFYGKVLSVGDKVKIDLNHPLAGMQLHFMGHVVESRPATTQEIQGLLNRISGEGGCCCGGHHGDGECCGHHGEGEGCGHHHGDGEGCGHHHGEGGCCGHHDGHKEGCHHKHD